LTRWLRVRVVLDRVVAVLLLLPLAPVIGVLALLVRRHDGGPGLIRVQRVGCGGRTFGMWKVRSMRVDRADGVAAGVPLTGALDPRLTPIGIRMRAYYLDEMPQLFNVARGEMSLLGPRPEAPEFVDGGSAWRSVLTVPPGIAGPTQLVVNDWERELITEDPSGSAYVEHVVPVKVALDGWYVRRSSPALDTLVLVTLFRRLLPGTGSYTLKKLVRGEVAETAVIGELEAFAPVVVGEARAA
jgi:lipopolysaccharide/colanic/teichoic acid biosynthesis glycosyltransferase